MNKQRDPRVDVLKGLGILIMVSNHTAFSGPLMPYIRAFSMPLFFIMSGYLYSDRDETLGERFLRKFRSLMIPYIAFGLFFTLLATGEALINGHPELIWGNWSKLLFYSNQNPRFCGSLWFFPCLLITDLVFTAIRRTIAKTRWGGPGKEKQTTVLTAVLVCAVAALGCVNSKTPGMPILPWSLDPAMTALFFLFFGTLLRRMHDRGKFDPLAIRPLPLFLMLVLSAPLAYLFPIIDMRAAEYSFVPLYFLNGCLYTVLWMNVSGLLLSAAASKGRLLSGAAKGVIRFLTYLSKNGIAFVSVNWAAYLLFSRCFECLPAARNAVSAFVRRGIVFALVLLVCALVNELLTRTRFRIVLGKK